MRGMKKDQVARSLWGRAYDEIPKSVFAVVAFYLADVASTEGVGNGGEVERFRQELEALLKNQIIDEAQARNALKALNLSSQ